MERAILSLEADLETLSDGVNNGGQVVQAGVSAAGQHPRVIAVNGDVREYSQPSDADIDAAMAGTICRCGTYVRIRAAIKLAAQPT